ncbi:MAG: pili assembly chaperone [Acidobacteria bacterium]|nr:MAG: pili assembly chaperone [Acidobacteriota bacterium]
MPKQKGFSLIELLIVVAVILIIAAIAIPSFQRSRMAANEASAVGSLRYIHTAQITYAQTYPEVGYASDLATLGPGPVFGANPSSTNAVLLDNVLGAPTPGGSAATKGNPKSGYLFYVSDAAGTPVSSYSCNGDPVTPEQTGKHFFFSDPSGVIRSNETKAATVTDNPI